MQQEDFVLTFHLYRTLFEIATKALESISGKGVVRCGANEDLRLEPFILGFDAGRGVDHVADRRVIQLPRAADRADDRAARMNAHADPKVAEVMPFPQMVEFVDTANYGHGRLHGLLGVAFCVLRRPEQYHNAVTHVLHEYPAVLCDQRDDGREVVVQHSRHLAR